MCKENKKDLKKDTTKILYLRLNTFQNTRKSLSRIIRMYAKGKIEENTCRVLIYGFSHLCNYWKVEINQEIEKKLDQVIETLEANGINLNSRKMNIL